MLLPPRGQSPSFGSYVRQRRLAQGLSITELAEKLKVSKAFISLIESGRRRVDEPFARKLARALADAPELYADYARAERVWPGSASDLDESTLGPLARTEMRGSGEVPPALNVQVKLAKPSAVTYQQSRLPPNGVPIVAEGTCPEARPRGDEVECVRLDEEALPKGERMKNPYGWRLSETGRKYAPDILKVGDTVIISQDAGKVVEDEIYAVRRPDGLIVLSRVQIKGEVLLLMTADGAVTDALHAQGDDPESLVVGKVVIIIRPWRYAVLTPQAKR